MGQKRSRGPENSVIRPGTLVRRAASVGRAVLAADLPVQPETGIVPVSPGGATGDALDLGRLLQGEPAEIAELHQFGDVGVLFG